MIENCCKNFISLMDVDAEPENTEHNLVILNKVSKLYEDLIKEYKKVYEIESKNEKSNSWKQKYEPKNLKALDYQSVKLETKSLSEEDRSDIKQPTQLKQPNLNGISKPLWINLSREDFDLLINYVADNLDNKNYKTNVDGRPYGLENAKEFLLEIGTNKISKDEARNLYNSLIKPDVDASEKSKNRGKGKRNNILTILNNTETNVFDGVYFHYSDKPSEPESEEIIATRIKLRRQRLNEITEKEKKISSELFERHFGYSNRSYMYKALNETKKNQNKTRLK